MSRLPIRARLTLVFVAVMSVVLALIGTFLFYRTKHTIDDSIAQSLRARQGAARAYAESAPGGRLQLPPGERFAEILAPSGAVLLRRPDGLRPLLSPREAARASAGLHVFELSERERYLAGPATVGGRRVVVVVGASLRDHEKALEGLGGALLVGGPLALLLAAGIAYLIAAGALGPVEAMRRRAATISTADPTATLPESEVDDELGRLSVTLNAMLGRIARSAEHERRFIADASHELRTPLAALQAELELAERHASDAGALRAAIARSREDVARLIRLSDGLLDLAAAEEAAAGPAVPLDVDELLEAIAGDLRHRAAAEGRMLTVRRSGLKVTADELAVRRALGNLVENALVHGAGAVVVGADPGGDAGVVLWVHDDGTLPPELAGDRAFERFARGPDASGRPGAGLGLALVRLVADAHGGTATLAARPGGGVRAELRLPGPDGAAPAR
ncbi:HAMP domain-containing histidine kinase [Paraconexibacter antarcticus]|uniref:histidine kinase n=1 Tax=Paraconexibacter antarcticus TaxID=2949664 RepID=A0ABY5DP01_9ACTN|nr:HAMP domain-containing sensor histidine kinase [Paraconexibacter antarcticus]UTI63758.1 HAMP domain-containing histidine kinase [Paraconexibacter antarcticus]